jgi:very-short-patch-repair endonuclease
MTETQPPGDEIAISSWLDLHDRRRRQFVPALSVLSGPIGLGIRSWRRWLESRQQAVVQVSATDPESVVSDWTATLARNRNLIDDAFTYLSAQTGLPRADLRVKWASATLHDIDYFWDTTPLARSRSHTAEVCRWLMRQLVVGDPLSPEGLASRIDGDLPAQDASPCRVVVALSGLLPADALPALLLVPDNATSASVTWVDAAARLLAALVSSAPQLPAALAVRQEELRSYLDAFPESHARALVREGTISIACLTEEKVREQLQGMGVPAGALLGPVRRLAADGVSERLVGSFGETARLLREAEGEVEADRARSAAELFLYERLESLPETAGRFRLNAPLGFRFGNKEAEVDLFAQDFRLAVEIDGYYHFQDPEHYRRDRRKDWELQRRGYLVLRFLADDVVERMEEMLDTILAAVEHGRQRPIPPEVPST